MSLGGPTACHPALRKAEAAPGRTGYHGNSLCVFHLAVFIVAVTVFAAIAAATGAGLAAPSLLGRNLASYELIAVAAAFAGVAWSLTASRQRRQRKRLLEMRDSALW